MHQIYGAVAEFVAKRFGGIFSERTSTTSVGVAVGSLVGNDPERIVLVVFNLSVNTVHLGFDADVSSSNGILIAASGGSMTMNVLDDATLVGREIFAVAAGAASNVYALELRRDTITEEAQDAN